MTLNLSSMLAKFAVGVATAVSLAGGTAIVQGAQTNAVQDQRLLVLEQDRAQMHELSNKLDLTNRNVAVLNERLHEEAQEDGERTPRVR